MEWLHVQGFRVLIHSHSRAAKCDGWGVVGRNAELVEPPLPPRRDRELLGQLIAKYPAEAERILNRVRGQDDSADAAPVLRVWGGPGRRRG